MPPISSAVVRPTAAQEYAGLTRSSLRALHGAGLIAERGKLMPADVVIARLCRYLYWSGPWKYAPGVSAERDRQLEIAQRGVRQVRALLMRRGKDGVPERVVVSMDDGAVRELSNAGDAVNLIIGDTSLPGTWLSVPLREWWDEAKSLPTGSEGVVRGA